MPVGDRYHDDREFRPLALMDSDGVGRHYLVEVREGIFYLSPVKFDTYLVVVIVDKRYEAYVAVEDILFVIVLYLHYLVAETVAVIVGAANEAIVAVVEVVVVVGEVADRHEAFAFVLVELDIKAPLSDTRNHTGVNFAEVVGHVFHLLVFYRGALGIGGELLHIR